MNKALISGLALAFTLGLSGCQSNQQVGTVTGGVLGGALGTQVGSGTGRYAAIIAGTLIGGYLGGEIGKNMDENDRWRSQNALETYPTHQTSSWHNPDTGNDYRVTPTRTYESIAGAGPCREYTTEATIDGRRQTVYGNACRQSDGTWKATN